jgi:hypothetical protein
MMNKKNFNTSSKGEKDKLDELIPKASDYKNSGEQQALIDLIYHYDDLLKNDHPLTEECKNKLLNIITSLDGNYAPTGLSVLLYAHQAYTEKKRDIENIEHTENEDIAQDFQIINELKQIDDPDLYIQNALPHLLSTEDRDVRQNLLVFVNRKAPELDEKWGRTFNTVLREYATASRDNGFISRTSCAVINAENDYALEEINAKYGNDSDLKLESV